ncbi:hypothetical protein QTP88_026437 [Uroleucon formosanum]
MPHSVTGPLRIDTFIIYILFCSTKISEVNKRQRKRVKVECLECGSQFNDDFKKKHEEKLHRGKRVNIKHVGAPKNPFESAAATRNLNKRAMIPANNCSSSSVSYNDAEKRFKDKSEDKSDSTVQTLQTVQTEIVDSKFEKNDSSNSSVINNNNDEKLSKDKSDSTVQKDNVDSKSENCQQVIKNNIDENSEEISWLCAGQMEDLVSNLNECNTLLSKFKEDTLPNPIMFMLESQQVINRIKLKSECFLKNAKDLLDNLSDPSDHIQSVSKPNYFVEHDPGRRCDITSSSQRQYLLSLGPHQPKLLKYPINSDIDPSKQKSFNPIWLKEYPMVEYSLIIDSAYCFVCSLFPKGLGRQFSNEAWVKQGVNKWQKMKSRGKAKLGKLEQHFNSLSHKAALNDYRNFMKESNHIDIIMNKSKRQESIKLVQEKEFNKQIIIILFDIAQTLCRQGLSFRGDGDESSGNFNRMVQIISRHNPLMNRWINEKSLRSYNVTYLGPRSQNEFIDILSKEVRRIIVKEVQEASLFSVMADTTPDNSHKDRLAVCLRYVNNNGKAIERLLEIAEGVDKTGLGTAKQIIEILTQHSLGTDNLVFQSYDYASNMSGQFNGIQAKLSELVGHSVFYIPCQVHRMNTFLEHACNSSLIVSDMIDNLENLYVFFSASNKKYSVLNKQMDNSIKAVWVSYEIFDRNTRTKAFGINKKMHSFDFIVSLVFMKNIMYKLKSLTETLEAKSLSNLGIDTETDFKVHHRTRKQPTWLDPNAGTQADITFHVFYKKEFKCILSTLINLSKDNLKVFIDTIMPLYKIFSFPFKNENMSIENIKNALLIFPPNGDFAKCKDIEAIQAEFKLKLIKNHLRSTMTDNRLDSLMLLSIEKDILDTVDPKNKILNILNPNHNQSIRLATGAFRISQTASIMCNAGELLLEFRRIKETLKFVTKFSNNETQVPTRRLLNIRNNPNTPSTIDDTNNRRKIPSPQKIFTDASKSPNGTGFAFIENNKTSLFKPPHETNIFPAENQAIKKAISHAMTLAAEEILIISDSLSALLALENLYLKNEIIQSIQEKLSNSRKKIGFLWVPFHTGIIGNELADKVANEAITSPSSSTYEQLITILLEKCNEREIYYLDPPIVHVDFEKVVIEALKNTIGSHICGALLLSPYPKQA